MTDLACDIEVYAFNWFIDFYDGEEKIHYTFVDDYAGVKDFLSYSESLCYGFNFKHYDKYILDLIVNGKSPEQIKDLNDDIIGVGISGRDSIYHKGCYFKFPFYDLMDDTAVGVSLKGFEAHMGMPIVQCSVPFDYPYPLSEEQKKEVVYYLHHDTEATYEMFKCRKDYLATKMSLGKSCGLSKAESLYLTNAQLTAKYLGAIPHTFDDERNYGFPANIDYSYIPEEVLNFFKRINDMSISYYDVFKNDKTNHYDFKIGDCDVKVAWGGIHGAIEGYEESATEDRVIMNVDGDSFYPNIDRVYHYTSRAMSDPQLYTNVIRERIEAKKTGNKTKASCLKLVVNTTYGCKGSPFNPLCDMKNMRHTCITGQLLLLWLAEMLYTEVKSCKVIQVNTDGVMISVDKVDVPKVEDLCNLWQKCGISLETDRISRVIQRDVNNYIEVQTDGSIKKKGGDLVRGVCVVGGFKVNNQAPIIPRALENYLLYGKPVEETINESTNIFDFQLICKASHKYDKCYQEVNGEMIEVQQCNRVYATTDKNLGVLYKHKMEDDRMYKQVAGTQKLPEHCIIDNSNKLTIDDIDKDWYIDIATIQIMKFRKVDEKIIKKVEKLQKELRK